MCYSIIFNTYFHNIKGMIMQEIILGGGCFWCTQSVFLTVKGIISATSGYAGGQAETADYESGVWRTDRTCGSHQDCL